MIWCFPGATTRVREKKSGTPGGAISARTGSCVKGTRSGSSAARRKEYASAGGDLVEVGAKVFFFRRQQRQKGT